MDGRPHLFNNLPLPSCFLHRYQLILLGDRGTRVWTTCLRLLRQQCPSGSRTCNLLMAVWCCAHSATTSPRNWCNLVQIWVMMLLEMIVDFDHIWSWLLMLRAIFFIWVLSPKVDNGVQILCSLGHAVQLSPSPLHRYILLELSRYTLCPKNKVQLFIFQITLSKFYRF